MLVLIGCRIFPEITVTSSTKSELLTNYETLAVLGLDEPQEVHFISEYMALSPRQSFIERRRIAELISEQDLLPDRLNADTRAKIKEIFGVDALVLAKLQHVSSRWVLTVRIVDSETGHILSSCFSSTPDGTEISQGPFQEFRPKRGVITRAVKEIFK